MTDTKKKTEKNITRKTDAKTARNTAPTAKRQTKQTPERSAGRRHRTASKNARTLKRQQEVRHTRIVIGCTLAAVLLIVILAVFLPKFGPVSKGTLTGVNSDVLQYRPQVEACCKEYGISEYSTLLLALMQQESSGQGTDVFQCSESPFNTEYENYPGSIADPDYSIRVGVETFAYCLEQADCRRISDSDALKRAIQEYNFGNSYASWALENYGGYSVESAVAFSEMMKAQLGWDTYGDTEYVAHVLQYITF